ncbi:MAG: ATP-dependent DNA ligase [Opitutaceae bacterium]|nr:ATP-dependent DNA ligase [Opitutaceae bacterium]
MAWTVQYQNGVYLPQVEWWLDAHHPVARSFVSHAHFDHLAPHREILCSEGTARLMRARMPAKRTEHIFPFGKVAQLENGLRASLHPAGHIFGSAQSLFEHDAHGSLLYTGDFKLRPGFSAERCATPKADVLIMETTYGRSHYRFPPTEKVLADILQFCRATLEDNETPVLFGYSLGKSQEILQGIARAGLPVMLHPQTLRLTRIYEELGAAFPPYREFEEKEVKGHVVICPPQGKTSSFLKRIGPRRTAVITGWALDPGASFRYQCDAAFPLSDHADFDDLLRYVALVNPSRVLTLHGFAADFARTLRDRGIEAWALTQENQLELLIPVTVAPAPQTLNEDSPETSSTNGANTEPEAPLASSRADTLDAFAEVADQIKSTARKLEKIALLEGHLRALDNPEDASLAALYFTGRPFAQNSERKLNLGWSLIRRAVLAATNATIADFKEAYLRFRDSGDAAESLMAHRKAHQPLALRDCAKLLERLAAARGPMNKLELLEEALGQVSPRAGKYLIKIITGDLRIGLKEGLVEEAVAAATGHPTEAIREANMLSGDLGLVMASARANRLDAITLTPFQPVQFMLASPEPTAEALLARLTAPVWIEEKYDGIRCQLHHSGGRTELYSRDLRRITDQFPDLVRSVMHFAHNAVLDGELLAWRNGRALPFAELQKRLGRKGADDFFLGAEIPVSFSAYDLLWLDGESLLKHPLEQRRHLLERILSQAPLQLVLAPRSLATRAEEIEAAFVQARLRGNEGLMAKDPASPYTPGRRGLSWLKLKKAYATLDVVVVGVEFGHGKRRGVLSDYTFSIRDEASGRLLTVGKAYSGLTDAEIAKLTEHFVAHTIEEHGSYRTVEPNIILEIAFDSIQPSSRHQSGFALRFPRIVRVRDDKGIEEIDTLETCRRLAGSTAFAPAP